MENTAEGEQKFLTIEGGDAVGKSTAARGVYQRLVVANVPVVLVEYKRPRFLREHVQKFMSALETVLLGPRHLLTDRHWVHLTAAWYHVIDQYLIRPALQRGEIVIADSWHHKPLTRFWLQDRGLYERALEAFSGLAQPDLVCVLDLDPETAAQRKTSFGFGETGNFEARRDMTRENFLIYQSRFRQAIRSMAEEKGWPVIEVEGLEADAVADRILDLLKDRGWL